MPSFETDPYVWFDPFEERARAVAAEYRVAAARDAGRREVLQAVTDQKTGDMHRLLDDAIRSCVERAARIVIWPWIEEHRPTFQEIERRQKLEMEAFSLAVRPTMIAVHDAVELRAEYVDLSAKREPEIHFTILSMRPIQVSCAITARPAF